MGFVRFASIAFLSLLALSGPMTATAPAGDSGPASAGVPQAAFLCPDLARTELFRSKGLGYIHTLEFADAVSAVACGKSVFSPSPLPEEWKDASGRWLMHILTHEAGILPRSVLLPLGDGFSPEETPCDPQLLHKSSLEFRSRPGNGNAGVVYPYYVPMAAYELEKMILPHSVRAARIAAAIELAERLGATTCSPALVESARAALDGVRRAAAEWHYDAASLEPSFSDAERLAEELSEGRRIAAAQGVPCIAGK